MPRCATRRRRGRDAAFDAIAPQVHYRSADVQDLASLGKLRTEVDALAGGGEFGRLCYLALEPRLFAPRGDAAVRVGHRPPSRSREHGFRRVIIEKPFGHDLASAHA